MIGKLGNSGFTSVYAFFLMERQRSHVAAQFPRILSLERGISYLTCTYILANMSI